MFVFRVSLSFGWSLWCSFLVRSPCGGVLLGNTSIRCRSTFSIRHLACSRERTLPSSIPVPDQWLQKSDVFCYAHFSPSPCRQRPFSAAQNSLGAQPYSQVQGRRGERAWQKQQRGRENVQRAKSQEAIRGSAYHGLVAAGSTDKIWYTETALYREHRAKSR